MSANPISCEIDFDRQGKQFGYLRLPHSVHRSAYGYIPIPVGCIANGVGPRIVLMAGNHGDEYEGQIILSTLLRTLEPADVRGRIIIVPMANFPAAEAGLRTSPIDQGNLNRSFVESPLPGPTGTIADYLGTTLFQGLDLLLDVHSGGSSLFYLPSALAGEQSEPERAALTRRLLDALALPYTLMHESDLSGPYATSAAQRAGGLGFTLEIAGGGTVTPAALRVAKAGILRCLAEIGTYTGAVEAADAPTSFLDVRGEHYGYAPEPGLFELLVELGAVVEAGQPAARIHRPETPGLAPIELSFAVGGKLICQRVPARVIRGDCLYHLAAPAGVI